METERTDIQRLSELIHGIQYAMLTTTNAENGTLRSRPMTLQQTEFDGHLWLFTGRATSQVTDIEENPQVNLAFSEPKDSCYISVSGVAEIVIDRAKAAQLWSPILKAWFPNGVDDPDLALIKVHVESADYWKSPSAKVVQLLGFAKAILTGQRHRGEGNDREHLEMNP